MHVQLSCIKSCTGIILLIALLGCSADLLSAPTAATTPISAIKTTIDAATAAAPRSKFDFSAATTLEMVQTCTNADRHGDVLLNSLNSVVTLVAIGMVIGAAFGGTIVYVCVKVGTNERSLADDELGRVASENPTAHTDVTDAKSDCDDPQCPTDNEPTDENELGRITSERAFAVWQFRAGIGFMARSFAVIAALVAMHGAAFPSVRSRAVLSCVISLAMAGAAKVCTMITDVECARWRFGSACVATVFVAFLIINVLVATGNHELGLAPAGGIYTAALVWSLAFLHFKLAQMHLVHRAIIAMIQISAPLLLPASPSKDLAETTVALVLLAGVVLAEGVGWMIGRVLRTAYFRAKANPPAHTAGNTDAASECGPPRNNELDEQMFTTWQFHAAMGFVARSASAFAFLVLILGAIFPSFRAPAVIRFIASLAMAGAAKFCANIDNVERARRKLGSTIVAIAIMCLLALHVLVATGTHELGRAPAEGVYANSLLVSIPFVHLRLALVPPVFRAVLVAIIALGILLLPASPSKDLPQTTFVLCILAGVALGEGVGWMIGRVLRTAYFRAKANPPAHTAGNTDAASECGPPRNNELDEQMFIVWQFHAVMGFMARSFCLAAALFVMIGAAIPSVRVVTAIRFIANLAMAGVAKVCTKIDDVERAKRRFGSALIAVAIVGHSVLQALVVTGTHELGRAPGEATCALSFMVILVFAHLRLALIPLFHRAVLLATLASGVLLLPASPSKDLAQTAIVLLISAGAALGELLGTVAVSLMRASFAHHREECRRHERQEARAAARALEAEAAAEVAQRRAEEATRLFHALDHPVSEYDRGQRKAVRCNEAFASLLGTSMEEALADAASFASICHRDDRTKAEAHIRETAIEPFRCRVVRRDGVEVWVEVKAIVSPDERHTIVQLRPLCDEMALEAKTAEMEGTLRMLDEIGVGVIRTSLLEDGLRVSFVSPAWERITGWSSDEVVGKPNGNTCLHGADTEEDVLAELHSGTTKREPVSVVLTYYRKDGTPFKCHTTVVCLNNGEYGGTIRDVTAQFERNAEQARVMAMNYAHVEAIGLELRQLVEYANAPIFGVDVEGNVNEWNAMTARITGYTKAEAIGKPLVQTFIEPQLRKAVSSVLKDAQGGEGTANYELEFRTKDGETRYLLVNATTRTCAKANDTVPLRVTLGRIFFNVHAPLPLWFAGRDVSGAVTGVVGVAQDVTDLQSERGRSACEKARAEAEQGLNEFLAHEVRNPLSVAMEACRFVQPHVPDAHQNDVLLLLTSLGFINELLSNLLDFNKFAAGKIELRPTIISVQRDVVDSVVTMLGIANGPVRVHSVCEGPLWIEADALRLKQLVMNLAKNAVKFTEEGWVRVRAWIAADTLHLFVEDTGPGIADPSKLFRKYEQLNDHAQGTGIGLALCAQIVSSMGGTIEVDQSYRNNDGDVGGVGARVAVRVPVAHAAPAPDDRPTKAGHHKLFLPKGMRVLVVDDDDVVRAAWSRRLYDMLPCPRIEEATTGECALRLVKLASLEGLPYALVSMDHYMATAGGRFTGTDAIKSLRASGYSGAVVGYSGNDKAAEHIDAGADLFFRKPLPSNEAVVRSLASTLRRRMLGGWKVLVVDDAMTVRMMWQLRLVDALPDALVVLAEDGHAALSALRCSSFDLVLLDQNLGTASPRGTAVVRTFREEFPKAQTIVIGMSASSMESEHLEAGCDASWDKLLPPKIELRDALLQLRASRQRSGDTGLATRCEGAGATNLDARLLAPIKAVTEQNRLVPSADTTKQPVLAKLIRTVGETNLSQLAPVILRTWPEYVKSLRAALISEDAAEIKAQLHRLKGSLSILEDETIDTAMRTLHQRAIAGNATPDEYESLFAGIDSVLAALSDWKPLSLRASRQHSDDTGLAAQREGTGDTKLDTRLEAPIQAVAELAQFVHGVDTAKQPILAKLVRTVGETNLSQLAPVILRTWPEYVQSLRATLASEDAGAIKTQLHRLKGSLSILEDETIDTAMRTLHQRAIAGNVTPDEYESLFARIDTVLAALSDWC